MSQDDIIEWLESNYNGKIQDLRKHQQTILEKKELEFKNNLIDKSHDYRDVKFSNITNENKIDINNLLQKFRYNKDLLIEKRISDIVKTTLKSLYELIDTHEAFSILYYSNIINDLVNNYPNIRKIYFPNKIKAIIPKLNLKETCLELVCSENIEIGIIGELDTDSFIHFSPEIKYENNKDEIRKFISKLLTEESE